MIGHKLPNKTKSATVTESKLFHQLNNPLFVSLLYSVTACSTPAGLVSDTVLKGGLGVRHGVEGSEGID
jgi:hypothetical protein